MENSVGIALERIKMALLPQVFITHAVLHEDSFFREAIKAKSTEANLSLISLPSGARDLMWLSKLDSNSLNGTYFPIVSHKTPHTLTNLSSLE
jgi:hypothetical protein